MMMKKVLLVESNDKLESYYSLNLYTWVGLEVLANETALFATKHLEENNNQNIDLIITRARNKNEKSAEIIAEYLEKHKLSIPLMVIGNSELNLDTYLHIPNGLDVKVLVASAAKLVGVTAKSMAEMEVPDYFPIPWKYFAILQFVNSTLYKQNEETYEIFCEKDNSIDQQQLANLRKEEQEFVYVEKQDRLSLVSLITQEFISKIEPSDLNNDEKVSAAEMSNELLREKLSVLGLTGDTIALAQKNMKAVIDMSKKSPKLSRLMQALLRNKASFLFKHTQVLTYICHHIIDNLDWGAPEQKEKVSFICFFHDIVLKKDEYAMIRSEQELKNSSFDDKEKELIKNHAQLSATLISKYPKAPMGSDIIIKQHHGIAHGIGFSETYGANLSPMTIVFILAEDYTESLIKEGVDFSHLAKIAQMRERYSTQRFQKILDLIEELAKV